MMTEISTVGISRIPGKYTISLIGSGAVPDGRCKGLSAEISVEFAELCGQFTRRESGSVSEQNGEMIMSSVLYTVDSYLLGLGDGRAAAALVSERFHDIYMRGCGVLSDIIGEGERLSRMVFNTRLNVETPSYRFVCEKAFGEFLSANKQIRFDCENIFTSIDYPLLSDLTDISGGVVYAGILPSALCGKLFLPAVWGGENYSHSKKLCCGLRAEILRAV